MRSLSDEEETVMADQSSSVPAAVMSDNPATPRSQVAQPGWMRALQHNCETLVNMLPASLSSSSSAGQNSNLSGTENPLTRFYNREIALGQKLLKQVSEDLQTLISCCKGETKQTNHIRALIDSITKGAIPAPWHRYKFEKGISLMQWMTEFGQRLKQLERIAKGEMENKAVWLGGLFRPAGWITASRQQAAHAMNVSLEALQLSLVLGDDVDIGGYELDGEQTCKLVETKLTFPLPPGFVLQGATLANDNALVLNDGESSRVARTVLRWLEKGEGEEAKGDMRKARFACPVYLTADRDLVLFTAELDTQEVATERLVQRGVCILANVVAQ